MNLATSDPVMERAWDGTRRVLPMGAWHASPTADELSVLDGLGGPVLDVGCGPGRIVEALAARGVAALGIDVAPAALAAAMERRAPVLDRSVFDRIPGEGRWATVLLLDGNIGIGGDPRSLLVRIRALLGPAGVAVVEVEPPGSHSGTDTVRLHTGDGEPGPWFPWAWLSVDAVEGMAHDAGLAVRRIDVRANRYFAELIRGTGCDDCPPGRTVPERSER